MNPVLNALLQAWDWRLEVLLPMLLAGGLFVTGWRRLRHIEARKPAARLATGQRLAAYLGGLALIAIALLSPIDVLSSQLFTIHMVQHLLLVMFAPPLLWLAAPFPISLWGLPSEPRKTVGRLFAARSTTRRVLQTITGPAVAWILFIAIFVGWHDPNAYNAALSQDWVHDLEHLTFFGSAMLFWWHVIGAGPRLHPKMPLPARIAYVVIVIPINMFTGVAIAFSETPIYTFYAAVPRWYGLSVMEDQMIGGVIMWVPGSMMYLIAAVILIAGVVQAEANKNPLPESVWSPDETMLAP